MNAFSAPDVCFRSVILQVNKTYVSAFGFYLFIWIQFEYVHKRKFQINTNIFQFHLNNLQRKLRTILSVYDIVFTFSVQLLSALLSVRCALITIKPSIEMILSIINIFFWSSKIFLFVHRIKDYYLILTLYAYAEKVLGIESMQLHQMDIWMK